MNKTLLSIGKEMHISSSELLCVLEIWSRNLVMNLWLHSLEEIFNTFINEYSSSTIAVKLRLN